MAKCFSKMYGNKGMSLQLHLQSSRFLSAPDATSLPTSLPREQAAKTKMLSVVRIQPKEYLVLCTDTSRFLVLFTRYLTSTNMPTA